MGVSHRARGGVVTGVVSWGKRGGRVQMHYRGHILLEAGCMLNKSCVQ